MTDAFLQTTVSNTSSYTVEIVDVFNPTDADGAVLTYTLLCTLPPGGSQQVTMKHDISQIQAMYTGVINDLSSFTFYRFPIAVASINRKSYQDGLKVTDDDFSAAVSTQKFIEYVSANPNSKAAKDFSTALGNTDDQEGAVNAFFKTQTSFSTCTLDTWTFVTEWQVQFLSGWQGTYYIYSNPEDASKTPIVGVAQLVVSGTAAGGAVLSMTDAQCDVPSNPQTAQLMMAGDGTMCETDAGSGPLAVSLQPVWMNLLVTDNGQTKYVLGSAVAGTINGNKVAGTLERQDLPSSDSSEDTLNSNGYKIFEQVWDKVTGSVGLLIGFATMFIMYKQLKSGHDTKTNEIKNNKDGNSDAKVDEDLKAEGKSYGEKVRDGNSKTASTRNSAPQEQAEEEEVPLLRRKQKQLKDLETAETKIEDATVRRPPSQKTEEVYDKIVQEQTDIVNQSPADANAAVDDIAAKTKAAVDEGRAKMGTQEAQAMEEIQTQQKTESEERKAESDAQEKQKQTEEEEGEGTSGEETRPPIEEGEGMGAV